MQYRLLGKTGLRLSELGLGAAPLGGVYQAIDEAQAIRAVHATLDMGVNYIDTSPYYGLTRSEAVLGKALQTVPRDSYILSTKVGRYDGAIFDFSADRVIASVDESLQRLNVDYTDIIICHDIEFGSLDQIVEETLPALRRVQAAGKARFIGISGLPLKIFRVVSQQADIDLILSYCHYALNDTSLTSVVPMLQEKRIGIINASALAMGLLTEDGPPAWHPASEELKSRCAEAARYCRSQGVDIAQLALQFSFAQSDFASTLVGVISEEQMAANIRALETPLDEQLLGEVQAILTSVRDQSWISGRPENND